MCRVGLLATEALRVNPTDIRFIHASVSNKLRSRGRTDDLIDAIAQGRTSFLRVWTKLKGRSEGRKWKIWKTIPGCAGNTVKKKNRQKDSTLCILL